MPVWEEFLNRTAAALLNPFQPPVSWHWTSIVGNDMSITLPQILSSLARKFMEIRWVTYKKVKKNVLKKLWVFSYSLFPEGQKSWLFKNIIFISKHIVSWPIIMSLYFIEKVESTSNLEDLLFQHLSISIMED